MRARIEDGLITSIGNSADLPFELPQSIGYDNFKDYICTDIEACSDIKSWKSKHDYLDAKAQIERIAIENSLQQQGQDSNILDAQNAEPETEEVDVTAKSPSMIVIISYLFAIMICILVVASIVQSVKESDYVSFIALVVMGVIMGFILNPIIKDFKKWLFK